MFLLASRRLAGSYFNSVFTPITFAFSCAPLIRTSLSQMRGQKTEPSTKTGSVYVCVCVCVLTQLLRAAVLQSSDSFLW